MCSAHVSSSLAQFESPHVHAIMHIHVQSLSLAIGVIFQSLNQPIQVLNLFQLDTAGYVICIAVCPP